MKFNDNRKAIIGTTITHVIVLLLLILLAFKTPLPLPEEIGVEVVFEEGGGGSDSPLSSEKVSGITDEMTQPSDYTEKVVKQTETSVNLSQKTQPQEVDKKETEKDKIDGAWDKVKEAREKQSGSGSGTGSKTGTGTGAGNDSGIGTGTSDGAGPSFNLHGRYRRSLSMPDYTEKEQGRVVVEIWVDRNGNVTRAIPGFKGSTTVNSSLMQKAREAALSSKFSSNPNAPEEQKGTITYNFIKLK